MFVIAKAFITSQIFSQRVNDRVKSQFSNVSVFDTIYLKSMISDCILVDRTLAAPLGQIITLSYVKMLLCANVLYCSMLFYHDIKKKKFNGIILRKTGLKFIK